MNIIDFYRKESTASARYILIVASISGLANGALLAIISAGARSTAETGGHKIRYFFLFFIAFLTFLLGKKYALTNATVIIENLIKKVRLRISDKIRKSELLFFENLGKSYVYTRLTQDTNVISQSATIIINSCHSGIILIFCLIYISWLSILAFVITIGTIIAGAIMYFVYRRELDKLLQGAVQKETEFFESLSHILNGFKELKVNKQKSDDLFRHFQQITDTAEEIKVKTGINFIKDFIFSSSFVYTLIAIIVFLLPTLIHTYSEIIVKVVMAILFIVGPMEMLVGSIPVFARANVAVGNLYKLEDKLDKGGISIPETVREIERQIESFREIRLDKVTFQYRDIDGTPLFTIKPTELSIKRGDILFVVGGNGSGKSTLMKLLTGLYYPEFGVIRLDGEVISKQQYPSYRELFSIIFSDFHLFDRLYGLDKVDSKKVNDLIDLMQLTGKTSYMNGKFTNINLSTGQRKRLALIVAFLDDRPIYMFDEVAADQDPEFKKYFYEELLMVLKKQGKTIILTTHDDQYFEQSDWTIYMRDGEIEKIKPSKA